MAWSVELFEGVDGACPVGEFLERLDKPRRAKVIAVIALLGEQGPFVLLHAFRKRTEATPGRDIVTAGARMRRYLQAELDRE